VDGLHCFSCALGLLLRSVGDQVEGPECAGEPVPEVASVVGVVDDASGDERMGDLEEHRRPTPRNGVSGELPTLRITLSGAK
jgi:hypothetical protein